MLLCSVVHTTALAGLETDLPPVGLNLRRYFSGLPHDCLTEIFHWARDASPPGLRSLVIVHLSHVCHTWRDIILRNGILWCVIDVPSVAWTKEFFERSKGCGLDVTFDGSWFGDAVPLLAEQLHRVRVLKLLPSLEGKALFNAPNTNDLWKAPATSLVNLDLIRIALPEPFHTAIPNLSTLSLNQCDFGWSSTILTSSLTTLVVLDPHRPVSILQLVDLLRGVSALRSLALYRIIDHGFTQKINMYGGHRPIKFPFLQSIQLAERDPILLSCLFSYLDLSCTSNITAEVYSPNNQHRFFHAVLSSVSNFTIRNVQMAIHPTSSNLILQSHNMNQVIKFSWRCSGSKMSLTKMFDVIPLHRTVNMDLDYISENHGVDWLDLPQIIARPTQLEQLRLRNDAAIDFFFALPLPPQSLRNVRSWTFHMQPHLFDSNDVPERRNINILELTRLDHDDGFHQVEFKGGWWELCQEEIMGLEGAGWEVITTDAASQSVALT